MKSDLKARVRDVYGEAALRLADGRAGSCCGMSTCCVDEEAAGGMGATLYEESQKSTVPALALRASLGCGNPTALAPLRAGDIVLDLGSGGGLDVLLSARRVGPTGKAYGVDMTDAMLELARRNQADAGVTNAEFLKGEIESIPLPDESVDVVISNCVINLSTEKDRVLAEAFRVLKRGGRFAVSDVIVKGEIPSDIRRSPDLWVGCMAGALEEADYRARLEAVGFTEVGIEPTRVHDLEDAGAVRDVPGQDAGTIAAGSAVQFMSAFVRATKP